jgi:hypothetical protein
MTTLAEAFVRLNSIQSFDGLRSLVSELSATAYKQNAVLYSGALDAGAKNWGQSGFYDECNSGMLAVPRER